MRLQKYLYLTLLLLITLAACSNADEPIIDENLLGVVWKVDSLQTPNGDQEPCLFTLFMCLLSAPPLYHVVASLNSSAQWVYNRCL